MSPTKVSIRSAVLVGVESMPVTVEACAVDGPAALEIASASGNEGPVTREARTIVRSALRAAGVEVDRRVLVTVYTGDRAILDPSHGLDLPIALAVAGALGRKVDQGVAAIGALNLDNSIRPVRGMAVHVGGIDRPLLVPVSQVGEVRCVPSCFSVYAAVTLAEALRDGGQRLEAPEPVRGGVSCDDIAEIPQASVRRALEVAAAGGHSVLLHGDPGSGKAMAARRLAGLLPIMTLAQAGEVFRIHSAAGLLPPGASIAYGTGQTGAPRGGGGLSRPFRAPHYTVSEMGLTGGGAWGADIRPGEVTLAHHGVLFLDELAEFRRSTLEALARVMREGEVVATRKGFRATMPARFHLVAATSTCGCGEGRARCKCSPERLKAWRARMTQLPLWDSFAMHVQAPVVDAAAHVTGTTFSKESSAIVRARVTEVAPLTARRAMEPTTRGVYQPPAGQHTQPLSPSAQRHVMHVARTIADLAGCDEIQGPHVAEALTFFAAPS